MFSLERFSKLSRMSQTSCKCTFPTVPLQRSQSSRRSLTLIQTTWARMQTWVASVAKALERELEVVMLGVVEVAMRLQAVVMLGEVMQLTKTRAATLEELRPTGPPGVEWQLPLAGRLRR